VVVGRDTTLSWGVLTDYIVYSGDQYGDDDEEDRDDEDDRKDEEGDREDEEDDRDKSDASSKQHLYSKAKVTL
jgi:hypothetical protein